MFHTVMGWPGPMTHRQSLVWVAWLELQWDRPSRSDWYMMQAAAAACGGKNLADFKLKFEVGRRTTPPKLSKAIWYGVLGIERDGTRTPGR